MPKKPACPGVPRATDPITDQEADRPRNLNFGREQVLNRLWELATLSHEATRGSIAGQMKALALIAAIEGLIPDRRFSSSVTKPVASPVEPDIYKSAWLRKQQEQAAGEKPGDPMAAAETQPAAPQPAPARRGAPSPEPALSPDPQPAPAATPSPSDLESARNQPSFVESLVSQAVNWVPQATGRGFDALLDSRQPFSIKKGRFGRR